MSANKVVINDLYLIELLQTLRKPPPASLCSGNNPCVSDAIICRSENNTTTVEIGSLNGK